MINDKLTRAPHGFRRLLVTIVLTAFPFSAFSDVSYTPKSGNAVARILIFGQIRPDDLERFVTFANMARKEARTHPHYQVRLNSLGGDVRTALAVGRIVRLDRAAVAVLRESKCLSSCVFILAGGVIRFVEGSVGIHRPFAPADTRTMATLQKQNYERLESEVKAFLRAVNIPADLYDHMLRVPPDKVRLLSQGELQKYGLSEDDPYEDAARIAGVAASMGITSEELIRRQAMANSKCSTGSKNDSASCYTRIIDEGK